VILTSSQHAAQLLERDFSCAPQCIHPVPDAVNLDFFQPGGGMSEAEREAWKVSLGIPPERTVVVYLGLLTDYQGVDKLLQAAAILRDRQVNAHFLIMGYPSVAHYRKMATDLELQNQVTFTGKVPYDEAPRHLALGDIAATPKLSDTEGSGKILNYMAMRLPTVAFDMPVSREFLGGLGVYAARKDARGLADALQSLIIDPDWAKSLGHRLRQRAAERYAWDQAGRKILSIYDGLFQTLDERDTRHEPTLAVSNQQHKGKN
jgi:glycosyltransferase involved in cell wall biosynthesis